MLISGICEANGYGTTLSNSVNILNVPESIDLLGLSLNSIQDLLDARSFVTKVRAKSNPLIVAGGTICVVPELVLAALPETNLAVMGEGDDTILEILKVAEMGGPYESVEGMAIRSSSGIIKTSGRPLPSLQGRPFPKVPENIGTQDIRGVNVYMETHRGCIGECTFCLVHSMFGRNIRWRPVEEVTAEMKYLRKRNVRRIGISGGTVTLYGIGDDRGAERFTDLLRNAHDIFGKENVAASDVRVDCVDQTTLKAIKQFTNGWLFFGIESGSNSLLKTMRKGIDTEVIEEKVQLAKQCGLKVNGSFIVGHPSESEDQYLESCRFLRRLNLDDYSINIADPIVGTPLYHGIVAERARSIEDSHWFKQSDKELKGLKHLTVAEYRHLNMLNEAYEVIFDMNPTSADFLKMRNSTTIESDRIKRDIGFVLENAER